jgi:hypothetical protein
METETNQSIPRRFGPGGWLIAIVTTLLYLSFGLRLSDGTGYPSSMIFAVALWTGAAVAYRRRMDNRSSWIGFLVGFLIGLLLTVGSIFFTATIRGRSFGA